MSESAGNPTCPNCGAARTGRYCAGCGQDNRHLRIGLRSLASDAMEALFAVEGRLWNTLRDQTLRPGLVARRFLAGQRARYLPPLRYVVVTCALWWLVLQWVLPPQYQGLVRHGNWLNLLMLPALAVPLWIAFLGSRLGYFEHLCVLAFVCGQVFTWRALLALLGAWQPTWGTTLNSIDMVAFLAYCVCSLLVCHWRRVRWVWLRVAVAVTGLVLASNWLVPVVGSWLASR